mmetsp:Transcript_16953/g.37707  ORF Transcript_16953/g.37707 Transcript_16953/m.37707 type:complete len:227 (-) Transcript_16953:287-967(-)
MYTHYILVRLYVRLRLRETPAQRQQRVTSGFAFEPGYCVVGGGGGGGGISGTCLWSPQVCVLLHPIPDSGQRVLRLVVLALTALSVASSLLSLLEEGPAAGGPPAQLLPGRHSAPVSLQRARHLQPLRRQGFVEAQTAGGLGGCESACVKCVPLPTLLPKLGQATHGLHAHRARVRQRQEPRVQAQRRHLHRAPGDICDIPFAQGGSGCWQYAGRCVVGCRVRCAR